MHNHLLLYSERLRDQNTFRQLFGTLYSSNDEYSFSEAGDVEASSSHGSFLPNTANVLWSSGCISTGAQGYI